MIPWRWCVISRFTLLRRMDIRVVVRVGVEIVKLGLHLAVHVVPVIALELFLVENGAVGAQEPVARGSTPTIIADMVSLEVVKIL